MTAIAIIAACYFGTLLLLSILVRPMRRRMLENAQGLLNSDLTPAQQELVKMTVESAYSMREAPIAFFHIMAWVIRPMDQVVRSFEKMEPDADFWDDPRATRMFASHLASVAAVNPAFGILAYAARALFRVKIYLFLRGATKAEIRHRIDGRLASI